MGKSLEEKTNKIKANALAAFIDTMCTELVKESDYSENVTGEEELEEAAGRLADEFMQRLSEDQSDADPFDSFIADVLEGRVNLFGAPAHEPCIVDVDCVMLNIIDVLSKSSTSCKKIIKLPMPEIIDEPDLTQNVSYTLMASAIGKEAYVLARPAETPLANLIKTISKGRLTAFACFVRDLPNGKCTFQVVLDLRSGKSIRATISTSDVSATPRKWMLRRIDLADTRADFTTDGDILSLETRIPFSGRNVKALQSIAPVDREFRGLIDMSSKALNGELLETVLSESKNGQRVWKAILGGDSIADYAGALDCTSKFHGYKLEYRIVKDGAVEQIAARKGFAIFRFRKQIADDKNMWRDKLHGARKQGDAGDKPAPKQKLKPGRKAMDPEPVAIGMADAIVRSNLGNCTRKKHRLSSLRGRVSIITRKGKLFDTTFPITFCATCKKYFIREETYEKLRNQGILCCRIIEEVRDNQKSGSRGRYDDWNEESIIHQYGYNVNAKQNLSEKQRHKILSMIIEYRIQTKHQIIDFIQMQVDQRSGRPHMENAVAKWKRDIQFLEEYKIQNKSIDVRSMRSRR